MQERKKKIQISKNSIESRRHLDTLIYLRSFDRFDPAVGRTSAAGRAYLTAPKLAFAGKFIH